MTSTSPWALPYQQRDCVPPDPFWNANRELAELLWRRGDGGTISTRVSEDVHRTTGVATPKAKTTFHALLATGIGAVVAYLGVRATNDPALRALALVGGAAAGVKSFEYFERDRCR